MGLPGGREGPGQAGGVALCEPHGVQQGQGTPFQHLSIYIGACKKDGKNLLPRPAVTGRSVTVLN